ncbi:hypothetical protein VKT23_017137 [Stygiomarasmius scandens]|uniref:Uncharacterized protein n=1 Tax=Marasmiellus scandens TaxID=2682957 RepID=A0ABR1ISR2_9AGAR
MADLPPRPDVPPPPPISRRDDRPYPLRDSYEPRYDRRDPRDRPFDRDRDRDRERERERERDRDRDSRDRDYDRDYDRRYRPPPRWDDRRGPSPYDRRPPPRYRSRSRERDRFHDRSYDRYPPRSPPRSPPRRDYYRPRSRSRTPPRRLPPPPSPPRMQRRRSPTPPPRRSPPPPHLARSRSPPTKRIKLGSHSIGSPPYGTPPLQRPGSPYSRPRSPPRPYSPSRRYGSDRGSEKSYGRRDDRSRSRSPIMRNRARASRSSSPYKESFDSGPSMIKTEEPFAREPSSHPPPPPPMPPDVERDVADYQGDIIMKSEPEPPLPRQSLSPPRHPRRRDEPLPPRDNRDPWHDTPGPHPPTQPRSHGFIPRGAPIRGLGRGAPPFRGGPSSGFAVEPPRAPRNRGIPPTAPMAATSTSLAPPPVVQVAQAQAQTTIQSSQSPLQISTPTLPTPTLGPNSTSVAAADTKQPGTGTTGTGTGTPDIFAHIPEPIIPDYRTLLEQASIPLDRVTEMDMIKKQIVLAQKQVFSLSLEYGNVQKTTRRALHEFEMASFDLRAAVKKRESTRAQLELAREGVLGIDFQGKWDQDVVEVEG